MFQGGILFLGVVLEGFFYGLYSAIFSMHVQLHLDRTSKEGTDKTRNIVLYALCILYILCTAAFVLDTTITMVPILSLSGPTSVRLGLDISWMLCTIIGLCNFISQAILIYRCWIIWGCNIRVMVIPSILALAFLATWLAVNALFYIIPNKGPTVTYSGYTLTLTSLAISLVVNGVVTGLIVLRILKAYWEIRPTFEDQTLGTIGGTKRKTRSLMFIIIESGMAMFTVQSIAVVLYILQLDALSIVVRINQMFYGITPTIILVRVLMGLSFYDETSMVEITMNSWHIASHNQNPIPETASIDIVGQERRDHIGVQQIDDIEIVDR